MDAGGNLSRYQKEIEACHDALKAHAERLGRGKPDRIAERVFDIHSKVGVCYEWTGQTPPRIAYACAIGEQPKNAA